MQTTVLVSILVLCVGAAAFVRLRPRWTPTAQGRPDDLGGSPVRVVAPIPGPQPVAPPAPVRAEAVTPAPAVRVVEVPETRTHQPAPAHPAARRAHANNGFSRFGPSASPARTRTGRA